jgi:hypothetical protein
LTHSFAKISVFCDAHPLYLIYNIFTGSAVSVCNMSDQSDNENKSEEQVHMSEGTSPSSSSDEGSRSTPRNLPKAATRASKKRISESEDEDYVAEEEEATSKKKVLKKEYGTAAATKPGVQKKAPARRVPTSKPRKVATGETIKFTMESEEEAVGQDKKKKRVRTTTARVLGKPSMRRYSEEEEEEVAAPAPKAQKLMGDAIKSGAASSKPK